MLGLEFRFRSLGFWGLGFAFRMRGLGASPSPIVCVVSRRKGNLRCFPTASLSQKSRKGSTRIDSVFLRVCRKTSDCLGTFGILSYPMHPPLGHYTILISLEEGSNHSSSQSRMNNALRPYDDPLPEGLHIQLLGS